MGASSNWCDTLVEDLSHWRHRAACAHDVVWRPQHILEVGATRFTCKKQSSTKQSVRLVNTAVNKTGFKKTWDDLTWKISKDAAGEFEGGKANVVEQRRLVWTTACKLDGWCDAWKKRQQLIQALPCQPIGPADHGVNDELVFFSGMKECIINVDKTDGSLDDTKHQRGGCPPLTFCAPGVAGGGTAANKSGHSSTVIWGSGVAGELVLPNFQLKTIMAQTMEGQRVGIHWIVNSKDAVAKHRFSKPRAFPCAFGTNKKGFCCCC